MYWKRCRFGCFFVELGLCVVAKIIMADVEYLYMCTVVQIRIGEVDQMDIVGFSLAFHSHVFGRYTNVIAIMDIGHY